MFKPLKPAMAFTLAELLIALAILGVIATFTIPKVLTSQTDAKNTAIAKEDLAAVAGALQSLQLAGGLDANSGFDALTPYLNYISVDTATVLDTVWGNTGSLVCGPSNDGPCIKLHNGSIIQYYPSPANKFGGTTNNYIYFKLDPDGKLTSSSAANGPGKMADIVLYYNAKVTFMVYCSAGSATYSSGVLQTGWCSGGASTSAVPEWGRW